MATGVGHTIINNQYNNGHICTRQQCDRGRGDKVAMRWIARSMEVSDYTFRDLENGSNRFANALNDLGFAPGDVFFTFLPKMPEQFFAFLGALKLQVIAGTLFANFGEEALRMLMREDPGLFGKFDLSHLKYIFSVGEPLNPEVINWARRGPTRARPSWISNSNWPDGEFS